MGNRAKQMLTDALTSAQASIATPLAVPQSILPQPQPAQAPTQMADIKNQAFGTGNSIIDSIYSPQGDSVVNFGMGKTFDKSKDILQQPTGPVQHVDAKGLAPDTSQILDAAFSTFGKLPYGGLAHRNINGTKKLSDHATGHAVDLMVPPKSEKGNALAEWAIKQPNVKYVIWNNKFASSATGWKWEPYSLHGPAANQKSSTGRHEDHVHVSTVDNPK